MNRTVSTSLTILCLLATVFLIGLKVPVRASPNTIYVPLDYPTIQEGIDAAQDGDTVYVYNGTYYESVIVGKAISLVGQNKSDTVIDVNFTTTVVSLGNEVTMTGFTIKNGYSGAYTNGIRGLDASNCSIHDNIIKDCRNDGIWIGGTNRIYNNTFTNNGNGIGLAGANDTVIEDNIISDNRDGGIVFWGSASNNTIRDNVVSSNGYGISMWLPFVYDFSLINITIEGNQIVDNKWGGVEAAAEFRNCTFRWNNIAHNGGFGIKLAGFSNSISSNNITDNNYTGIIFYDSHSNIVSRNNVANNTRGIEFLSTSYRDEIFENNITANNDYGVYVGPVIPYSRVEGTRIYHNSFTDNLLQAFCNSSSQAHFQSLSWDDGYPSGGNYWSDFGGNDTHSGPYQNETGYDWIGDSPYIIDQSNTDRYPLTQPFESATQETQVAYRNLLGYHNELLTNLATLNASYQQHLLSYSSLQQNYTSLQSSYEALNASYQQHLLDYTALQTNYNNLNSSFTDYKASIQGELDYTRNLVYALAAITAILVLATVYLAARKPKTKPET